MIHYLIVFNETVFNDTLSTTVKALLSPRGAYLILGLPEGGLNREEGLLERGAYSQNQAKRIYLVAFQFLYSIFCGFNTQFSDSNTQIRLSFYPISY